MQSDLTKCLNGWGTEFDIILNSLRGFLCQISELNNSIGGALVFFRPNSEDNNEDLSMRVFPFKTNIPFLEKAPFTEKQKVDILNKISEEKAYSDFWHFEHFKNKNHTSDHFTYQISDENYILNYNDFNDDNWVDFYNGIMNGTVPKNTYEQLLFSSGCSKLCFIPIPVLSTPSILVVLEQESVSFSMADILKSIYFRSREPISTYIDIRVSNNIKRFIEDKKGNITERQLVDEYIKQIADVLLPISYQINEELPIIYYKNWPNPKPISTYKIDLLGGKYTVKYQLTSFHYLNFQNPSSYKPIHYSIGCETDDMFFSNLRGSADKTAIRFEVLHSYWSIIKNIQEEANNKLVEAVSELETVYIKPLEKLLTSLKSRLHDIETKGITYQNQNFVFTVNENLIQLVALGGVFYRKEGRKIIEKIRKNQRKGLYYLYYILKKSQEAGNKFTISAENLYDEISKIYPFEEPKKMSNEYKDENLTLLDKSTIEEENNEHEFERDITYFENLDNHSSINHIPLSEWVNEYINCLQYTSEMINNQKNKNGAVRLTEFKPLLYRTFQYYTKVKNSRLKIDRYLSKDQNLKTIKMQEQLVELKFKELTDNDSLYFDTLDIEQIKDIKSRINDLSKLLNTHEKTKKTNDVRTSINSVMNLIFKQSETGGNVGSFDILKNNFQKSGLYDLDSNKVKDGIYRYDNDGDWHINWLLEEK